jgi:phosphatidylserine/phosphatidylglycerophosphate/cardiolipin synthase-like enzyme
MALIDTLKAKWFLTFSVGGFPPQQRYPGCTVSNSTDGNLVTPLIDGQSYMALWYSLMLTMTTPTCEVYHSGWRLEGVRTLGNSSPASDALDVFNAADDLDAQIYMMVSRHGFYLPTAINVASIGQLQLSGVFGATLDNRFPTGGSNHHKFTWLKSDTATNVLLGSVDISKTRWDRPPHAATDPERDPTFGKPTHDLGVRIQGPAVADIQRSFRDRWNDFPSRIPGLEPTQLPQPTLTSTIVPPAPVGTHSVQVLHTYGITNGIFGYTWSPVGDFTIWAAYLNALKKATTYIFIEDQYFLPFDWPTCHLRLGAARDSDIIYQLGEAIKRGVKVIVVVPSNAEDPTHKYQQYHRDIGVRYLQSLAASGPGDFIIATLSNGTTPIYVHAKLLICDDEYVQVGSANVCQRSMTHDGELDVGIVDANNTFARELRKSLWAEHLGVPAASLDDPTAAVAKFKANVAASLGQVRPYVPLPASTPVPFGHREAILDLIDPYAGPPR